MRKIMYKVKESNGNIFDTASYPKAIEKGRIVETYFITIDERTEKEKEYAKEHVRKVREALRKKRG